MTITVNGVEAEPGCYIAGHHGQYGLDALGDVADQFDIALDDEDDPRYWRRGAEAETSEDTIIISNGPNRIGNHIAGYEECFERQVWAADKVEELLNAATTGGYWTWQDGEFFLCDAEEEEGDGGPFDIERGRHEAEAEAEAQHVALYGDGDAECDECGSNDVVGCIGGTHYHCARHEAAVADRHARDLIDWSDATPYEIALGLDN